MSAANLPATTVAHGLQEVCTEMDERPWRRSGKCKPNMGDTLPLARRRQCVEATDPAPLPVSTPATASRIRQTTQGISSCSDQVDWQFQYDRLRPELPSLKYSIRSMAPPGCSNPSLRQRPQMVSLRPQNTTSPPIGEGSLADRDTHDRNSFSRASAGTPATPIWELLRSEEQDRAIPALMRDRALAKTPLGERFDRGKLFDRPFSTDTVSTHVPERPESMCFFRGGSATPGTPVRELLAMGGSCSPQEPRSPTFAGKERGAFGSYGRGRGNLERGFGVVGAEIDESCTADFVKSDLAGDSFMRSDLAGDSLFRSEVAGDSVMRSDLAGDSLVLAGDSLISTWSDVSHSRAEWDARLWCEAREEWSKMGDWRLLHNLWHLTRRTTEQALMHGMYKVDGCTHELKTTISVPLWFGEANVKTPPELLQDTDNSVVPPLLVCDADPLEIAMAVRRIHGERQQIIIVAEMNEFDSAGGLDFKNPASVSPASLTLRTNFETFVHEAQSNLRDGVGTMRAHLSAPRDPYVFYCPDVTVFRGPREDGYPFLSEPTHVDVIATSAFCMRPELNIRHSSISKRHMEWFAHEEDHYALLDRLHLLGLVGLGQAHAKFVEEAGDDERPILILGTLWCGGGRAGRLPRHAYAHALKGWSEVFCRFFRSVFVCCGGEEARGHPKLGQLIDRIANMSTYDVAQEYWHVPPVMRWHWNAKEIKLAIRPEKLEEVYMVCQQGHNATYAELCDRAAILGIDPSELVTGEDSFEEEECSMPFAPPVVLARSGTAPFGESQPLLAPRSVTSPLSQTSRNSSILRSRTTPLAETQMSVWEEVERFNHHEEVRIPLSMSGIPHSSKPVCTWRHSMVLGDVSEELHHPGQTMLSPRESSCVAVVSGATGGTPIFAVRPPSTPTPQKRRASYFSKAMGSKTFRAQSTTPKQASTPKTQKDAKAPQSANLNAAEINELIASANKEFDLVARQSVQLEDIRSSMEHDGVALEDVGSNYLNRDGSNYLNSDTRNGKKASSQRKKPKPKKIRPTPQLRFVKPHYYRNNPNEPLDAIRRKVCEKVIKAMQPSRMDGHVSSAFEKYSRADDSEDEQQEADDDQFLKDPSAQEQVMSGRRLSDLGCLGSRYYHFPEGS